MLCGCLGARMATKGPYDQATWNPMASKTTFKAPKAMSLQAFKVSHSNSKESKRPSKCHNSRLHTCPVTNSPRARVEGGALPRDAQPLLSRVGPHTSSSHSLQPPLSLINPNLHSKFLFIFIFSPHAKQTALLKKRLAEAMVTAQAAAGAGASSLKKEEAMGDVRAISAELMVGRCRLTPGTPWFSQLTPRLLSGTFSS